jgi:hypothetical protein
MGAGLAGLGEDFPNEPPPPKRFASTLVIPPVIPNITIINATQSFFMVPPKDKHAEKIRPTKLRMPAFYSNPAEWRGLPPHPVRACTKARIYAAGMPSNRYAIRSSFDLYGVTS